MNKDFNFRLILRIIGSLLLIESVFILSTCAVSLSYGESDWVYFAGVGVACIALGFLFVWLGRNARKIIGKREGSVVVTLVWIVFSLAGLMPFWLSGSIPSFTDAFFETMSGFTTTSATILDNIESLSHGMLYWRSLTNWIGGMGIIVISLALLPMFGFSGIQLFGAENTGITKEKLHPKITETAKRLCYIYILLTATEFGLLMLGGMDWFDALCHAYSTISTGGFSTKQASIAYWQSPYIQYIIIVFMLLSGVNFSLYYFMFIGKWRKVSKNEELRFYLILIAVFSGIVIYSLLDFSKIHHFSDFEKMFRTGLFQITSLMTSTGFATVDFMQWKPFTWIIIIFAMLIGASAGSTTGGIKVVRVVIAFKYCYYEFKRMIHPNAVIPVTYSGETLKPDVVTRVLVFILLYFGVVVAGVVVLTFSGLGFTEAVGGMISCLGCMGIGLGKLGPADTFQGISEFAKWFLAFVMLVGRLELFTVLLLFTPVFWRK